MFDKSVKALTAEVLALKTAHKKSGATMKTTTKTATCTAQLYKNSSGTIVCRYAGLVEITPAHADIQPLISFAQPSYSSRGNRIVTLTQWAKADGTLGVLCIPSASSADSSMANNSTKNVTLTVYVTATDDFTTSASQVGSN